MLEHNLLALDIRAFERSHPKSTRYVHKDDRALRIIWHDIIAIATEWCRSAENLPLTSYLPLHTRSWSRRGNTFMFKRCKHVHCSIRHSVPSLLLLPQGPLLQRGLHIAFHCCCLGRGIFTKKLKIAIRPTPKHIPLYRNIYRAPPRVSSRQVLRRHQLIIKWSYFLHSRNIQRRHTKNPVSWRRGLQSSTNRCTETSNLNGLLQLLLVPPPTSNSLGGSSLVSRRLAASFATKANERTQKKGAAPGSGSSRQARRRGKSTSGSETSAPTLSAVPPPQNPVSGKAPLVLLGRRSSAGKTNTTYVCRTLL